MAVAVCIDLPPIPAPPTFRLPFFTEDLEAVRRSLRDMPDASEYLADLIRQIQIAMMPVQQLLSYVQFATAMFDCAKIVFDILTGNLGAVADLANCPAKIYEGLVLILGQVPPIPYVRLATQMVGLVVAVIDELALLVQELDNKITDAKALVTTGVTLGDARLTAIGNCVIAEAGPMLVNGLDLFKIVWPPLNVIFEAIKTFVPPVEPQITNMQQQFNRIDAIKDGLIAGTGVPAVGDLVDMLYAVRTILVPIYNVAAAVPGVGITARLSQTSAPNFVNF